MAVALGHQAVDAVGVQHRLDLEVGEFGGGARLDRKMVARGERFEGVEHEAPTHLGVVRRRLADMQLGHSPLGHSSIVALALPSGVPMPNR